ncbi:MAG: hypothetical protein ACOC9S_07420 [Planctomycetota bacterium]
MTEQQTRNEPKQTSRRQWGKYVFILLIIFAVVAIWWSQRRDPRLDGWLNDYEEASRLAREQDRDILLFFTKTPMGREDRRMVSDVLNRREAKAVIEYEEIIPVHLRMAAHSERAARLGIDQTPALVLLSPEGLEGEPPKVQIGFLRTEAFAEFLDSSVREAMEAQSSP